ncbi:unnamed protein product, partial [Nesidiocoris tenuis]
MLNDFLNKLNRQLFSSKKFSFDECQARLTYHQSCGGTRNLEIPLRSRRRGDEL